VSSSANTRLFFGVEWETQAEKSKSGYKLKVARIVSSHRKVTTLVPVLIDILLLKYVSTDFLINLLSRTAH